MHEKGQGMPPDIVRAHMWFNLSGAQGHEPGLRNRDRVAALMTREQIAAAQKLTRGWKPAQPAPR
jgi:TPR repeat protein